MHKMTAGNDYFDRLKVRPFIENQVGAAHLHMGALYDDSQTLRHVRSAYVRRHSIDGITAKKPLT